jgi:hypothetical protein
MWNSLANRNRVFIVQGLSTTHFQCELENLTIVAVFGENEAMTALMPNRFYR